MILQDIRVIEWPAGQVGPVACTMLDDMGAEVIKVEGFPLKLPQTPTPEMGQRTGEVLPRVCALSPEEIKTWRQEGVV